MNVYIMKMQISLIFKEYFNTLRVKPWHHGEDLASASQGIKLIINFKFRWYNTIVGYI